MLFRCCEADLNKSSSRWTTLPVQPADFLTGREGHTMTLSNGRMLAFGDAPLNGPATMIFSSLHTLIISWRHVVHPHQEQCYAQDMENVSSAVFFPQPYFSCVCDNGWESADCSKEMMCPVGAQINSHVQGMDSATKIKRVTVTKDFSNDCSQHDDIACPAAVGMDGNDIMQCMGKGVVSGKCLCKAPWTGIACNILEKCQRGTMERHAVVMGNVFQGP